MVCEKCGHDWPDGWGTKCHECHYDPSSGTLADDKPPDAQDRGDEDRSDEPKRCTCGDSYRNSYNRRCMDCEGVPSGAQLDARVKKGAGVSIGGGGGVRT